MTTDNDVSFVPGFGSDAGSGPCLAYVAGVTYTRSCSREVGHPGLHTASGDTYIWPDSDRDAVPHAVAHQRGVHAMNAVALIVGAPVVRDETDAEYFGDGEQTTTLEMAVDFEVDGDADDADDASPDLLAAELDRKIEGAWSGSLLRAVAGIVIESDWLADLLAHRDTRTFQQGREFARDAADTEARVTEALAQSDVLKRQIDALKQSNQWLREQLDLVRTASDTTSVGADATPLADGVAPTAGQLWRRLLDRPEMRIAMLSGLMAQADRGEECFRLDHPHMITTQATTLDRLTGQLPDVIKQLAIGVDSIRADHVAQRSDFENVFAALDKRVRKALKKRSK